MTIKDIFASPKSVPLYAGLLMIISGLAGGIQTKYATFQLQPWNGALLALIGLCLVVYSLRLSRAASKPHPELDFLRRRYALSENQTIILRLIEDAIAGLTRDQLETAIANYHVNIDLDEDEAESLDGRSLSIRLKNLELQGFVRSERGRGEYVFFLSEPYREILSAEDHESTLR